MFNVMFIRTEGKIFVSKTCIFSPHAIHFSLDATVQPQTSDISLQPRVGKISRFKKLNFNFIAFTVDIKLSAFFFKSVALGLRRIKTNLLEQCQSQPYEELLLSRWFGEFHGSKPSDNEYFQHRSCSSWQLQPPSLSQLGASLEPQGYLLCPGAFQNIYY